MSSNNKTNKPAVLAYMEELSGQLTAAGRTRTAETYTAAQRSFRMFRNGDDIAFDDLSQQVMQDYEQFLARRGVTRNTSSFYMRILRTVFNKAAEQGLTSAPPPFGNVYTGIDKTVKRAITLDCIRRIKELGLSHSPALDFARDMFMFSFYTRGMSFVDMAYLRKKDLTFNTLTYRRKKTGQLIVIRWEKPMRDIVAKYAPRTPYLLPIIKAGGGNELTQYRSAMKRVNRNLKAVAARIHLQTPLTMYVARHSWASAAQSKNIPLAVISKGMGHDSEQTTRIYLSSLDTALVDKANRKIMDELTARGKSADTRK